MNASKLVLFEAVRGVLAGRIQDDDQVREIAVRIADESLDLRRRIERAVGYARSGLRLEACAEAEAEPSIHELAIAFASDEMRQWSERCDSRGLPRPEPVSEHAIGEIDEAIAFTAPLRGRLALMRRLVLADAPAWSRLEVLRDLIARDPENPAWTQDRDELELVAAAELNARVDQDILLGNLEHAAACIQRLEDGKWHQPVAGRLAAQCRRRLGAVEAERATVDAAALMLRVEEEWAAENDEGARAVLLEWDALARRIFECGGRIPEELGSRAQAAAGWLAERDANAEARREGAGLVDELERAARDERTGLEALRAALRAAEQSIEGVPDDARDVAEARIAELERARRVQLSVRIGAVVVAVIALGWFTIDWLGRRSEETNIDQAVARARALLADKEDPSDVAAARRALAELEADPGRAQHQDVQALRTEVILAESNLRKRRERFQALMQDAGLPDSPQARPELVDRASSEARGEAELRAAVEEWRRKHGEAKRLRIDEHRRSISRRIEELSAEVTAASVDGSPRWDGVISAWRGTLQAIRGDAGASEADFRREFELCATAIATKEGEASQARAGMDLQSRVDALASAAADPARLASELARIAADHPEYADAAGFRDSAAALPAWKSLIAWPGIPDEPRRDWRQQQLSALSGAVSKYLDEHRDSPIAAEAESLRSALGPFGQWRDALRTKLEEPRFSGFIVVFREEDGIVRVLKAAKGSDPREAKQQQAGGVTQRVFALADGTVKALDVRSVVFAGPSPEHDLADALRPIVEDKDGRGNDVTDAVLALRAIADATASPRTGPAQEQRRIGTDVCAESMIALLDAMVAQMPRPVAEGARAAESALSDVRDNAPRKPADSGDRLRKALQPSAEWAGWEESWGRSLAESAAPLRGRFMPAGVVLRGSGGLSVRLAAGVTARSPLFVVGRDRRPVQVGIAGAGGSFEPLPGMTLDGVLPGSAVFARTEPRR